MVVSVCHIHRTEEKETDSMSKLKETLQSEYANKNLSNYIIEQTINYINTGFEDHLYRLCHCVYMWIWFGWVGDNCFTESSNSALACDPCGPKLNHKMHQATGCTIQDTNKKNNRLHARALDDIDAKK